MSKKADVHDAWDDDWESQADKADKAADKAANVAKAEEIVKVTKAERLAKHAETNRKIWESAYVLPQRTSWRVTNMIAEKSQKPFIF